MNLNYNFWIFGVPHGFDQYSNTGDNSQRYFIKYYDGSKDEVKMTINRNKDKIVYAYLRYNLISKESHSGSFFGMALEYDGTAHCTDIVSLYELFDLIYKKILSKKVLLKAIGDKQQFCVHKFEEQIGEINWIENNIRQNLKQFSNDFQPIDNSFGLDNLNKLSRIKILSQDKKTENSKIISALKEYPNISIAPHYEVEPDTVDTVPEKVTKDMEKKINSETVKKEIAHLKEKLTDIDRAVTNVLNLKDNPKRQKEEKERAIRLCDSFIELKQRKYQEYHNEQTNTRQKYKDYLQVKVLIDYLKMYADAKDELVNIDNSLKITEVSINEFRKGGSNPEPIPPLPPNPRPNGFKKFITFLATPILALSLLFVSLLGFFVYKGLNNNTNYPDQVKYNKLISEADSLLNIEKFDLALLRCDSANVCNVSNNDRKKAIEKKDDINNEAVVSLYEKADSLCNASTKKVEQKVKKYDLAYKTIAEITKYGRKKEEVDSYKKDKEKELITYLETELAKQTKQRNKKAIAKLLKKRDPKNENAKAVLNPPRGNAPRNNGFKPIEWSNGKTYKTIKDFCNMLNNELNRKKYDYVISSCNNIILERPKLKRKFNKIKAEAEKRRKKSRERTNNVTETNTTRETAGKKTTTTSVKK